MYVSTDYRSSGFSRENLYELASNSRLKPLLQINRVSPYGVFA
jgi:hypothetical protein